MLFLVTVTRFDLRGILSVHCICFYMVYREGTAFRDIGLSIVNLTEGS